MRDNTTRSASLRHARTKGPAVLLALMAFTTTAASTAQAADARGTAPVHTPSARAATGVSGTHVADDLRTLEAAHDVRIGAFAFDTGTGRTVSYRGNESFPSLSTFKAMVCAAVLDRARHAEPGLMDKVIHWTKADEVPNSPLTQGHGETGMTVADLCRAAITRSDNTAGNMVLRQVGGPEGLTRYYRSLGDPVSRLDRWEPELNDWRPGERRDTTTPAAMGRDLARTSLGCALTPPDRATLNTWLRATATGDARIRAGVPKDWTVGDKTGTTDSYGSANDIAVAWPRSGHPVIIAIYTNHTAADAATEDAVVRSTATTLVDGLGLSGS
ncbi:class A beta-lactamase [Streptomyces sp. NBC_00083]|uniref:class A beta-lactamase n=1 Tax=Streptomyces sp. NBC_00083 TaxID=2975647 RepID=UPI0022511938|nr:class A beta-lactamase [Streptomyces sp. NBC_00083]MCX5384081.1 class A beta-lactamase [Streptomyces sp. NBC_00083]